MATDPRARDGLVTLTGTAAWHYQREAAESRTSDVPGVPGIDNAITFTQAPDARHAADAIAARCGAMPCWRRTRCRSRRPPAGW